MQEETTQGGFLFQRGRAREWLDNIILDRVNAVLYDQAYRHGPVQESVPIIPTTGYDYGPQWGQSTIPDTTIRDQLTVFRGYLNSGYLMRRGYDATPPLDNGQVERISANYTLYLIMRPQIDSRGETSYQELATRFKKEAIRGLAGWTTRMYTGADMLNSFIPDVVIEPI